MYLTIYPLSIFQDNYIWLIVDENKRKAICVDPGDAIDLLKLLKEKGLTLEAILITHHHFDHVGGVNSLIKHYPLVQIYGPEDSRLPFINCAVKENDVISILDDTVQFKVLETPGHTDTHICFYAESGLNHPVLFCGDTLFSGGCGRLLGGTIDQLFISLQRLKALPPQTQIYCTHEYTRKNLSFYQNLNTENPELTKYIAKLKAQPTLLSLPSNIERESLINPFLRCDQPEFKEIFAYELADLSAKSIFSHLRRLKDNF